MCGYYRTSLVVAVATGFCWETRAGLLDRLPFFRSWSPNQRIESLIVTGNYAKSRLLAELVQYKTRQPVMLVSPAPEGNMELYFMPSGTEAIALPTDKYVEFIDYLRPKRVVFLGNEEFLPTIYLDMVRDRYPTVAVGSNDWQKNAEAMAGLFDCKKLPAEFAEYLSKVGEASAGRPAGYDQPAPGGPAEPLAVPRSVVPTQSVE
jgi:hypothetical protein